MAPAIYPPPFELPQPPRPQVRLRARRRDIRLKGLGRFAAAGLVAMAVWACGSSTATPSPSPEASVLAATATPVATDTATPTPGDTLGTSLPSETPSYPATPGAGSSFTLPPPPPPSRRVTVSIVAAGDIACDPAHNVGTPQDCDQAATAALIGQLRPTAVLPLGDLQYENGTPAGYKAVFGPTWGKYRSIMYPAIGNHEYLTSGAAGYFSFFPGLPSYYSYNLGDWHMVSLNSECSHVGGCQAGSAQERWLRADLAAHNTLCTLVYWHEPRFSSGEHGDATQMVAVWDDLVAARVEVVLTGHNHDYERFAPLNAAGQIDPAGVTEFVVGTGGKNHYGFVTAPLTGELIRNDTSFGVIRMLLGPTGYSWRFYPAPGYTFSDSGSASCH